MLRSHQILLAACITLAGWSSAYAAEDRDDAIFAEDNREEDMFGESDES